MPAGPGPHVAPPGRTDPRRTEQRILEAAREVLAADPFATLQRVANAGDVHRATVYRHFASREDVLRRMYDAWLEEVGGVVAGLDPGAPDILAELRRVTHEIYATNVRWKPFAWAPAFPAGYAAPRDAMIGVLERAFTRAREEGALRADMTVVELHTAWGAPIQYLSSRISDGSWTVDEAVAFTLRLVTPPEAERPTAR